MAADMMVIGKIVKLMVEEGLFMLKVIFMKVIGLMIRL